MSAVPDPTPADAINEALANADPVTGRALALGAVMLGELTVDAAAMRSTWTVQELVGHLSTDERRGALSPAVRIDPMESVPLVSVVVPALDEQESLDELYRRVESAFAGFGRGDEEATFELIIVDDGSKDSTWRVISKLAANDARVRGLRLSRNFGQQPALSAGMEYARGRTVCFLDADLQDPPELIGEMLELWADGHEVVYAVRRTRDAGLAKRVAYRSFYRLYRRLAEVDVPLDSGDFALLDRRVVDELLALPEHNRFLRGLRSWVGFNQIGLEYDRPDRAAGEVSYSTSRLVRLAVDGVMALSAKPLRAASLLGMGTALAGVLYALYAIISRITQSGAPAGWASTVAVILTVGGVQLMVIGILGEYLARVFDETKHRPNYIVAEEV